MSIRSDAYQLCKKIWVAPSREQIREIIWSLNHATEEQMRTGRHRAGFGASVRDLQAYFGYLQVLNYLIVDRDKATLEQSYPPLAWCDGLTIEERTLLSGTHRIFVELNNICVAPFLEQFPQFAHAVNPYSRFSYEIPADAVYVNLLQPEEIENMAQSFQRHPAFQLAADSFLIIQEQMQDNNEESFDKAVFGLEKQLMGSGPLSTPRELSNIFFGSPKNSQERIAYRLIAALLSIRVSLAALDELIFQAILTKQLPTLDENNIIEFGNLVSHASGVGLTILAQDEAQTPVHIGLALVKDRTIDRLLDLFYVEFIRVQTSQEFGDTVELHLREVNEDLNRFSLLLRNV